MRKAAGLVVVKRNNKRNNNSKETAPLPVHVPTTAQHQTNSNTSSLVPQQGQGHTAPKQVLVPDGNAVRKKPTPQEAELTAKNYRLAKELVCLLDRVRWDCLG
jgi:hypothetical protein